MPKLPTILVLSLITLLTTAPAQAWTPPPGHCILGAPETPMIVQAATLVSPLDVIPEQISAPCDAIAAAHATGRRMLTEVPIVVFARPAILDLQTATMGPEEIRRWSALFRPNAEDSLADAWPETDAATLAGWRQAMARGNGVALATDLEARATTTPPATAYAIVLSEGDAEMRFLIENPMAGLRIAVRVHLVQNQMAWSITVVPGLPNPYPLTDLLALVEAEAAANR